MGYWNSVKFFKPSEFACKCGCGLDGTSMDMAFIYSLDALREKLGFPLRVSSGARCPAHNNKVSSTGLTGPHTRLCAVDLLIYGDRAFELAMQAPRFGMSGIGINQKGPSAGRFVHLDNLPNTSEHPRPRIWSY
jgi:zinc D-Ala-D-Ala carboxypeptidase